MKVTELNRDQLIELKQTLLTDRNNAQGEGTSYGELAEADSLISDEEVYEGYADIDFSEDDFACSVSAHVPIDRDLEDAFSQPIVVTVDGVTYTLPAKAADLIQKERDDLWHMSRALCELVEHATGGDLACIDMTDEDNAWSFHAYVGKPYSALTRKDLRELYDLFCVYNDADRLEETAWDIAIAKFISDIRDDTIPF